MDTGGLREDTTKEGKVRRIHPRELTGGERTSRGRRVLTSVAALTAVGGFLADWNRTHLFNPNWPPHAKFHDALTIILGARGLYFLRRKGEDPERDLALGALLPSLFWIAQGASFVFPGAEGFERTAPA